MNSHLSATFLHSRQLSQRISSICGQLIALLHLSQRDARNSSWDQTYESLTVQGLDSMVDVGTHPNQMCSFSYGQKPQHGGCIIVKKCDIVSIHVMAFVTKGPQPTKIALHFAVVHTLTTVTSLLRSSRFSYQSRMHIKNLSVVKTFKYISVVFQHPRRNTNAQKRNCALLSDKPW